MSAQRLHLHLPASGETNFPGFTVQLVSSSKYRHDLHRGVSILRRSHQHHVHHVHVHADLLQEQVYGADELNEATQEKGSGGERLTGKGDRYPIVLVIEDVLLEQQHHRYAAPRYYRNDPRGPIEPERSLDRLHSRRHDVSHGIVRDA